MTRPTSALFAPGADAPEPLVAFWAEQQAALKALGEAEEAAAATRRALDTRVRLAERRWSVASDRFIDTVPVTLRGLLLQLEYVAETEQLREDSPATKKLILTRVVCNLIDALIAAGVGGEK